MSKTKKIRFDYFMSYSEEDEPQQVNLIPYLEFLSGLTLTDRIMPYVDGHSIRLSQIRYHANYQPNDKAPLPFPLWELTFTRMRSDVPGTTRTALPDLKPIDLEDDEYIAEDTVVLYDPTIHYLLIQRNRTGAPPSVIKAFFNRLHRDGEPNVDLQIVTRDNPFERAKNHHFHHAFTMRVKNIRNSEFIRSVQGNPTLNTLVQIGKNLSTEQEYPVQAELILKIPARNPEKTLKHTAHTTILNMLNPLIDSDIIDKLKVTGRTDEESALEEVDLVEDVLREWLIFSLENQRLIPATTIFDKLSNSFAQRRPSLLPTT